MQVGVQSFSPSFSTRIIRTCPLPVWVLNRSGICSISTLSASMKSIANSVLSHIQVTLYLLGIVRYRDKYVSRYILATKRFLTALNTHQGLDKARSRVLLPLYRMPRAATVRRMG